LSVTVQMFKVGVTLQRGVGWKQAAKMIRQFNLAFGAD
jgi:hypothetical protein